MPITQQGMGKQDLDTFLRAVATLNNELRTDRGTQSASYDALLAKLDADGLTDTDYAAVLGVGGSGDAWAANPAAAALVVSGFTAIDMTQKEMVDYLATVETLVNELRTDRATNATSFDALMAKLDADATVGDTDYAAVLGVGGSGTAWPANPAAAALDDSALSAQGVTQVDLVTLLTAIETLSNELRTDRGSMSACWDILLKKLDADSGVTDTDYEAVLEVGGTGDAWPADPSAAALDLSA